MNNHGKTEEGKQRFHYQNSKKIHLKQYCYNGYRPNLNQDIIALTKEGVGIWATARLLGISTITRMIRIVLNKQTATTLFTSIACNKEASVTADTEACRSLGFVGVMLLQHKIYLPFGGGIGSDIEGKVPCLGCPLARCIIESQQFFIYSKANRLGFTGFERNQFKAF